MKKKRKRARVRELNEFFIFREEELKKRELNSLRLDKVKLINVMCIIFYSMTLR